MRRPKLDDLINPPGPGRGGFFFGARDFAEMTDRTRRNTLLLGGFGLLAALLAAGLVAVFGITRPIGRLVSAAELPARSERLNGQVNRFLETVRAA